MPRNSTSKSIRDAMNTKTGGIVISAILGFGFATLFRQTCGERCAIVKAPSVDQMKRYIYDLDGTCYKYTPRVVACTGDSENST